MDGYEAVIDEVYATINGKNRRLFLIYDLRLAKIDHTTMKYLPNVVIDCAQPMWRDKLIRAVEAMGLDRNEVYKETPRVISRSLFSSYIPMAR